MTFRRLKLKLDMPQSRIHHLPIQAPLSDFSILVNGTTIDQDVTQGSSFSHTLKA